jgi:D-alanyl-D-alanine carboxypeptidase/lipoprotein-anchoring transpeptidase ErfK/SrfK
LQSKTKTSEILTPAYRQAGSPPIKNHATAWFFVKKNLYVIILKKCKTFCVLFLKMIKPRAKNIIWQSIKIHYGWLLLVLIIGSFYVHPERIINLDEDNFFNEIVKDLSSLSSDQKQATTTTSTNPESIFKKLNIDREVSKAYTLKSLYDARNDFLLAGNNLVEVNLIDKKIRVYKKGKLEKEVNVHKRGAKINWGGTPEGIYKVGNKIRIAYSNAAEAYMPFALQIYGKFYLHGIPYYPNGDIIQSYNSGGCVQMKDEDAETIFKLVEINDPLIVIDSPHDEFKYPSEIPENNPVLSSTSYLIADLDNNFVFISKNADKKYSIASVTKLMSASVVTENITLDRYVFIDNQDLLEAYGKTNGLEVGNKFRLYELLYPLLTESSNDAATLMGQYMGQEKTVSMMNDKAKAIMMNDTEFKDVSGYDIGNVSTVNDLFYLGRYAKNITPLLLEISKGKLVKIYGKLDFDFAKMKNKNVFWQEKNFIGGKTGFLTEAKNTGIFIFDMQLDKEKIKNYLEKKVVTESGVQGLDSQTADLVNSLNSTSSTSTQTKTPELKLPDSRSIVFIVLGSKSLKSDIWALKSWLAQNYFLVDKIK